MALLRADSCRCAVCTSSTNIHRLSACPSPIIGKSLLHSVTLLSHALPCVLQCKPGQPAVLPRPVFAVWTHLVVSHTARCSALRGTKAVWYREQRDPA